MAPASQCACAYSMASTWSKICTETTRVLSGILPPIISTTPNSPTVWANPRMLAVMKPGLAKGSTTEKKLSQGLARRVAATSRGRLPMAVKAFCKGCTTKGIE
ncbi:hypothetical protein D3C85_991880 [compost metagenome]